jgi:hypothetical protein
MGQKTIRNEMISIANLLPWIHTVLSALLLFLNTRTSPTAHLLKENTNDAFDRELTRAKAE